MIVLILVLTWNLSRIYTSQKGEKSSLFAYSLEVGLTNFDFYKTVVVGWLAF